MRCSVLLLCLAVAVIAADHGSYETADGSQCTWFERRPRQDAAQYVAACYCNDESGAVQTYNCVYEAENESDCSISRTELYKYLADTISGSYKNGCEADGLTHEDCPGVEMIRTDVKKIQLPCVPQAGRKVEL